MSYIITWILLLVLLQVNIYVVECTLQSDAYFSLDDSDCYGNYTVINADILTSPDTGLMYIISNSISTNGRWWYPDETEVQCSTSDASDPFLCQVGPGYITLYTGMGMLSVAFDGIYRACIDDLCLHVRIFRGVVYDSLFEEANLTTSLSYYISSNFSSIPQTFKLYCLTTGVPPTLTNVSITLNGDPYCDNTKNITCGNSICQSLVSLDDESFRNELSVQWSPSGKETELLFYCNVKFQDKTDEVNITIKAPGITPTNIQHYEINTTSIFVKWNVSDNNQALGYIIYYNDEYIDVLDNTSVVLSSLSIEVEYSVSVRAYYDLLGPVSEATSVILHASIIAVNWTRMNDISEHEIMFQLNCYTTRVQPDVVTWSIGSDDTIDFTDSSDLITSNNMTYNKNRIVHGSYTSEQVYTCVFHINGVTYSDIITQTAPSGPPTDLSVDILSSSTLMVVWTSPSGGADGYVIQYSPGEGSQLVEGGGNGNTVLNGLSLGLEYQIRMFAYRDLPSELSEYIMVLLDVPNPVTFINTNPTSNTSFTVVWELLQLPNLVHNYIITIVRICDGWTSTQSVSSSTSTLSFTNLLPGLRHRVNLTPNNTIGVGNSVEIIGRANEEAPIGYPESIVATGINSTSVIVEWGDVDCIESNGDITGYNVMIIRIEHNLDANSEQVIVEGGGERSVTITGLTPLSLYNIAVAAINSIGTGPYSKPVKVSTGPTRLEGLMCFPSTTGIALYWPPPNNPLLVATYDVILIPISTEAPETTPNILPLLSDPRAVAQNTTNEIAVFRDLQTDVYYLSGLRVYSVLGARGDWATLVCTTIKKELEVVDCEMSPTPSVTNMNNNESNDTESNDTNDDVSVSVFTSWISGLSSVLLITFTTDIVLFVVLLVLQCRKLCPNKGNRRNEQLPNVDPLYG